MPAPRAVKRWETLVLNQLEDFIEPNVGSFFDFSSSGHVSIPRHILVAFFLDFFSYHIYH